MSRPFFRIRLQLFTLTALLLVMSTTPVAAQTSTWNGGGGNGLWSNAANFHRCRGNLGVSAVAHTMENTGLIGLQNNPSVTVKIARATGQTGTVAVTFQPSSAANGLILQGSAGPQGQTFNLTGSNGSLTFGDNASHSLTGNITINNSLTLTMARGVNVTTADAVIAKTGTGSWVIGTGFGATVGGVADNATFVVNAGIFEIRSPTSLGTGPGGTNGSTAILLNAGTFNLRRDSAGTYGGAGTAYPVTVAGSATISVDRSLSSSGIALGLGKLTISNNATLTVTNGNSYISTFAGARFNTFGFITTNIAASNSTSGVTTAPINLNALYCGSWYLGALAGTGAYDGRYTANVLVAGNGNVYRLGGGGGSITLQQDATNAAINNVLTGNNSVQLGLDSGNLLGTNATSFQVVIGGVNNFMGATTIHRGTTARLTAAQSGGISGFSISPVNSAATTPARSSAAPSRSVRGRCESATTVLSAPSPPMSSSNATRRLKSACRTSRH